MSLARGTYAAALMASCVLLQSCFNASLTSNQLDGTDSSGFVSTSGGAAPGGPQLVPSSGNSYGFGSVYAMRTSHWTLTLTNTGSRAALTLGTSGISAPFRFSGGAGFPGAGGNCGAALSAGSSCQLELEFAPTSVGSFNTTLSVVYFDGASSYSLPISLSGTALPWNGFIYTASQIPGTITSPVVVGYSLNRATGVITQTDSKPLSGYARGVLADPRRNLLFVADEGMSTVDTFGLDPVTGVMSPRGSFATGAAGPYALALHPALPVLYVADQGGAAIDVFHISIDGSLVKLATSVLPASPWSIAVDSAGTYLYVSCTGGTIKRFQLNASSGDATLLDSIGTSGGDPSDLGISFDGTLLFAAIPIANSIQTFQIFPDGATPTSLGSSSLGANLRALAVHPNLPFVLAAGNSPGTLASGRFNPSGGITQLSVVGDGAYPAIGGLRVGPAGKYAFSANYNSKDIEVFRIDTTSGSLTSVYSLTLGFGPWGLAAVELAP